MTEETYVELLQMTVDGVLEDARIGHIGSKVAARRQVVSAILARPLSPEEGAAVLYYSPNAGPNFWREAPFLSEWDEELREALPWAQFALPYFVEDCLDRLVSSSHYRALPD